MPINWDLAKAKFGPFAFGVTRILMLAFVGTRIVELSDTRSVIKIPLGYRAKYRLGSMYFGAMAVGADTTIGGLAFHLIKRRRTNVRLIFKDFRAEYHQRAESDTLFLCDQGHQIGALNEQAIQSPERINGTIKPYALVPDKLGEERCA